MAVFSLCANVQGDNVLKMCLRCRRNPKNNPPDNDNQMYINPELSKSKTVDFLVCNSFWEMSI